MVLYVHNLAPSLHHLEPHPSVMNFITVRELFEGRVNLPQLKRARVCGVNSRVGRKQGNTVVTVLIVASR